MSLIVAVKSKKKITMGCDSRVTCGPDLKMIREGDEEKIVKLGNVYLGAAGVVSEIQILKSNPSWFDTGGKPLTKKFLVQNVIPRFYDTLVRERKFDTKDDTMDEPTCGARFIVTDGKRAFLISRDLSVKEIGEECIIGCGCYFALPILKNALKAGDPEAAILEALRKTSHRYSGVAGPYVLVNTTDVTYERIDS